MSFATTDDGAQIFCKFFDFNRPDATPSDGLIDCIRAFSEADFTEDLQKFDVPTLITRSTRPPVLPPPS